MKYSIIIPTLNEEKLIGELLIQLTNPDLRGKFDIEVIVSDGGSTDKTIEIAAEYVDLLIEHKNNYPQKIACGRNAGAAEAKGDILIFLNADIKLSDPLKFFHFIEHEFLNSNYLAMTCFVKIFPELVTTVDKIFHTAYNNYFALLNKIGIGMGRGECQVIRKEVFNQFGGYNEELAAGEDFDLFRRIRKKGEILFTRKVVVYESPRRFRKFGYAYVTLTWIKNGFSILIKNKAVSDKWEPVR